VLRIAITKKPDGSGALSCTRADGSVTWQNRDKHAAFFALHDITHFAVETLLGFQSGFFGLIAGGWDIGDTTGKTARGYLPDEALAVEQIVGMLDSERAGGAIWTADEFNGTVAMKRPVTDAEWIAIRSRRAELFRRWHAVPPGQKLQLTFG
jgi:hypothetical protein